MNIYNEEEIVALVNEVALQVMLTPMMPRVSEKLDRYRREVNNIAAWHNDGAAEVARAVQEKLLGGAQDAE